MIAAVAQSDHMVCPSRVVARLESIGLPLLYLSSDGSRSLLKNHDWVSRVIVGSAPFAAAVRQAWPRLGGQVGQVVQLCPSIALIPVRYIKPESPIAAAPDHDILTAVVFGHGLESSEEFRRICDVCSLDVQATAARIDRAKLIDQSEAERLAAMIAWMLEDAKEVKSRSDEIESMSQEISGSYEVLSFLYKLSTNMAIDQAPSILLSNACDELHEVTGLQWMAIRLREDSRLGDLAGKLFISGRVEHDSRIIGDLGFRLADRFGDARQVKVIDDTDQLDGDLVKIRDVARNLLVVPLQSDKQAIGILFGGNKLDGTDITTVDSKLCSSLAGSLVIFLENMMLYSDAQAMFIGTLHALTSAIDAKDSYTHGHSERVALMSRSLAIASGMPEDIAERVYLSGLIHDVGKIGVPEAVLCKPGRLTSEEFGLIKRHPEIGGRILKDIRQMQDLIPGVLTHHERWDGQGYPGRLKGLHIPRFGRVIGLADAFDAMMSDRTYRRALPLDQVLNEIDQGCGTQFDPDLSRIFLGLDFDPYFGMIDKHHREDVRQSA